MTRSEVGRSVGDADHKSDGDPAAPDAVLFDLDGTLCSYERPSSVVLEIAFERLGVEPCFEMADFHARYVEFLADSADGYELYERCFVALARDAGRDAAFGRDLTRAFHDERAPDELRALPGARAALDALAGAYRLGLVTNGHPDLQHQKLRTLGVADAFETIVFAGYETAAKPDPEPFRRALRALDTTPDRAVYVGNSPSIDVAGAQAAGLRAVWLATDGVRPRPHPEYVVESLDELREPPW